MDERGREVSGEIVGVAERLDGAELFKDRESLRPVRRELIPRPFFAAKYHCDPPHGACHRMAT
ncbi:hypothetical protein GCM10010102_12250 [Promicromonospora citrea]|uniref:Uncharacterized protein n=1 Tax=Promicromonospora citrea TaxID=43677 RepID=A0A8H9GF26_9MICO|nr:hypothetical protein GCM10010102_12250 [Promicromonospora citrea]